MKVNEWIHKGGTIWVYIKFKSIDSTPLVYEYDLKSKILVQLIQKRIIWKKNLKTFEMAKKFVERFKWGV